MLLLLDNFEHLVSAAPLISELLSAGPRLKIIVTSQSPLHVYGEHEFPVPPLALPDPKSLLPLDVLSRLPAIALFVERARAVKHDFALTNENASAVAAVCARLDGLPLAIELAAARIKLLSPSAMLARLESCLNLLTGGARDLPTRQQTLRGTVDWSYGLLNPAEQTLFRRLSVFTGGCTLEAVEAVCDTAGDLGLDVLDGMASMVDKSLAQQVEDGGRNPLRHALHHPGVRTRTPGRQRRCSRHSPVPLPRITWCSPKRALWRRPLIPNGSIVSRLSMTTSAPHSNTSSKPPTPTGDFAWVLPCFIFGRRANTLPRAEAVSRGCSRWKELLRVRKLRSRLSVLRRGAGRRAGRLHFCAAIARRES